MSAQSVAPRSRPSQPIDSDDALLTRAIEFSHWAKANVRLLVGGTVVALLLVGGVLYYRSYQANRLERAATEFMRVEQQALGSPQAAQGELSTFITRFDGTPYADEARLLQARLHLEAGNASEAVAVLGAPASRIRGSAVGAQAALLLAAAQEAAGDREAAIATYLRVADRAEMPFRQQEALSAAAALREQAGDFAGAAELYARLVGMAEEGTLDRSIFEMRRAEAEARARGN